MAGSVNKVILVGNLGRDPEVRTMQNGGRVANLSVATSESWNDKATGERREKTEWHRVVIFSDGLVGVVERYLKKGSKVYIEGRVETRKYEKDGRDVYTTEIVLQGFDSKLVMLDGRNEGGASYGNDDGGYSDRPQQASAAGAGGVAASGAAAPQLGDIDDDIPF